MKTTFIIFGLVIAAVSASGAQHNNSSPDKQAAVKLEKGTWSDEQTKINSNDPLLQDHYYADQKETWKWTESGGGLLTENWTWNDAREHGDAYFPITTNRQEPYGHFDLWTESGASSFDVSYDYCEPWEYGAWYIYTEQGDVGLGGYGWLWDVPQEQGQLATSGASWPWKWSETKSGTVKLVLHTGGKGMSGRQNLFALNTSATEEKDVNGYIADGAPVPNSQISVDGVQVGADGIAWKAYADGTTVEVTPQVTGVSLSRFTVWPQKYDLRVHSIKFNGTGHHDVLKDDGSQNPLPYDCLVSPNDHVLYSYPAFYESQSWTWTFLPVGEEVAAVPILSGGNHMETTTTFDVRQSGMATLLIRGVAAGGSYSGTFQGTAGTGGGTIGDWAVNTVADNPLPASRVDDYRPLTIKWQYSVPGFSQWLDAGTTTNEVYVSLAPPDGATLYHTVVHLACAQGHATTQAQAVADTWNFFSGKQVKTWDGQALHYYLQQDETQFKTTASLLSSHEGDCNAFCSLFHKSLQVNGVAASKIGVGSGGGILYPDGDGTYFVIKNLHSTGTNPNISPPYNRFIVVDSGIEGQNMTNPAEHYFGVHYIVSPTITGSNYYDPSYGITATSPSDYTTQAVGAWRPPNSSYYALPSDITPARILDFWDWGWSD